MDEGKGFLDRIGMDEDTPVSFETDFPGRVQTACVMHIALRLPIKMEENLVQTPNGETLLCEGVLGLRL